jgi:hypothetical protein
LPHDEFIAGTANCNLPGLRDDRNIGRLDAPALGCEEQSKREATRERHAAPLQDPEELAQAPLQYRCDTRDHASENWFTALFHDLQVYESPLQITWRQGAV